MAVDSSNKKKTNNKRNVNKMDIVKEKNDDIFLDKTTVFEDLKEKLSNDINKVENSLEKKDYKYLKIIFGIIIFLFFMFYLLLPKIYIKGDKEISIRYNTEYIDKGYTAKFLLKDISKNISVKNEVDPSKIGSYKVKYYIKVGPIEIKKNRIVHVIDDVIPEISTEGNEIKVCPGKEVTEISYKATDEYDGDITNKVISNYTSDLISLYVKDSSNNETKKEITVIHEDKEAPKINLLGNDTIYLSVGSKYNEPGYKAIDNCDGDITSKVVVSGTVGGQAGIYKLTYSVTDDAGNKTDVTRTVRVYNYNLYNSGTIGNGTIYLTFDDGPNQGTTNVILDVLKEEGIKATFFVTCNGPDSLIKRIYDEGHTLALHTATHDYAYVYSSVDNYFNDLNRVSNRVKNVTGIESKIIRFPGGSSNTVSRRYSSGIMTTLTSMVLDKGYRYFDWNVDSMDASSARNSSNVYNNVTSHLSKNRANVVLMHDTKAMTRDAIRDIIHYGKANGYVFNKIEMDTYMIRHGVNN